MKRSSGMLVLLLVCFLVAMPVAAVDLGSINQPTLTQEAKIDGYTIPMVEEVPGLSRSDLAGAAAADRPALLIIAINLALTMALVAIYFVRQNAVIIKRRRFDENREVSGFCRINQWPASAG